MDHKIYSDQTGKSPVTLFCGNKYIMLLFDLESNNILSKPMRNRTAGEMMRLYQKLIDWLKGKGIQPKLYQLDNESSEEFKEVIKKNGMKYELMPPHDHRRNISEKAIQVFKDHFVSVLCGTDKTFPCNYGIRSFPTQSTN